MSKIFLIIFILFSSVCSVKPSAAYGETAVNPDGGKQLPDLSYELAYMLETSGQDIKAAEGYVNIFANYPDNIPNFSKAFYRLELLYKKYYSRYISSKDNPSKFYRMKQEYDTFISSIKNVYDSYNMKGEYRKALYILDSLIRIEEKPLYYLDRGNIYLYGLNNPSNALGDFEKVMDMDPNNPFVYTDIGIANELLGNYSKAKIAYNKGSKIAPQHNWAHYGMSRARGIDLAADSQIIKDWLFIGQFDNSSTPLPVEKQIIEELDINKKYKLENDQELSWVRPFKETDFGFVNLSNIFLKKDFVRGYAMTWVYSPHRREVLFRVGGDDGVALWVNKNNLMDNLESRPARVDDYIARGYLREGWNPILLKVTQLWGAWGFYFRITDTRGNHIDDLIFDPSRDDAKAKRLIEGVEKNRFYKTLRLAIIYSVIFVVAIMVISILSINIFNTLKTRKMREDFISSITHDLKIPLAAIMAATEMLIDGKFKDNERRARYYNIIDEESRRLDGYVSKILEFSRNPRIKKKYLLEKRNIVSIAEKAIKTYKKDGLADDLDISLEVENNIPLVALDEEAFAQVMINLINNADKYSINERKIEIKIASLGSKVDVRVKDYGIGIRSEDTKLIFEDFFRSDNAIASNIPGAGLGLSFVKKIVEAHKGAISVESVPGKGSVFIVRLPAV